jgi:EAL domain-containing protein (putative c-di-GMP-specific phosphodiesterase class I)
MEHPESAATLLSHLKALGIRVLLDDFGTGYSSLSYLHQFPIDLLKIDRSFIRRKGLDGRPAEIVQAIVALAHHLSLEVVAEGVETAEQFVRLRALGCEYGQGYFFARPLDREEAAALVADELVAARGTMCASEGSVSRIDCPSPRSSGPVRGPDRRVPPTAGVRNGQPTPD